MSRNVRHLEILIGIILIIFALFSCYGVYLGISWRIEYFEKYPQIYGGFSWSKIIALWHLNAITSLLLLFGGLFQVLGKKVGWYSVTIYSIYSAIVWSVVAVTLNADDSSYRWIGLAISISFLFNLVFLFFKPIRAKYQTNKKSFLIVLLGVSLLLIDRFLI
jgi:hypothetical protein